MLIYDFWLNGWIFVSKITKSFNNLDIKDLYTIISKVKERLYFDYRDLEFSFDDQQLTLLLFCVLILIFNVAVICYIWRRSRRSIIKKFKKRAKRRVIEELKRSVDQLKLPKAHSPRM